MFFPIIHVHLSLPPLFCIFNATKACPPPPLLFVFLYQLMLQRAFPLLILLSIIILIHSHSKGCLPPCINTLRTHAPRIHNIIMINVILRPSLLKVSLIYHASQYFPDDKRWFDSFHLLSSSVSDPMMSSLPLLLARTRAVSPLLFLEKKTRISVEIFKLDILLYVHVIK